MRYLTCEECRRFGAAGTQNEVTPGVRNDKGECLSVYVFTQHISGWREPISVLHGSPTYGRLVEAIDKGEV